MLQLSIPSNSKTNLSVDQVFCGLIVHTNASPSFAQRIKTVLQKCKEENFMGLTRTGFWPEILKMAREHRLHDTLPNSKKSQQQPYETLTSVLQTYFSTSCRKLPLPSNASLQRCLSSSLASCASPSGISFSNSHVLPQQCVPKHKLLFLPLVHHVLPDHSATAKSDL